MFHIEIMPMETPILGALAILFPFFPFLYPFFVVKKGTTPFFPTCVKEEFKFVVKS